MVAAAYVLHGQADVKTAATAEAKLKQKETAPEPAAKPVEPKVEPEISITFSGDTMFDWQLRPVVEKYGADYPFQYVKPEIEKADYSFVNLESVFTTKTEKVPGQLFWIKSDPAALQAIRNTGYDMVSIGNNHTLDYGTAGLLDTIAGVEAMGLPYVGAGRNDKEAYTAKEVTIKGKKFKFLGFVRFMPDGGWVAGENRPGVAGAYDLDKVVSTIREQKGDADYLIVYIHWGVEKTNQPAAYQKQYTEKMVEAGANAIVGSHPHWLQGFEYYNGVPVAYSLGNFLFPAYVKGHAAETGVLTLKCKGPDISMSFEPYTIRNNQIQPLQGAEKTQMYQYLQSISYDIEFDAAGNMVDKRKH
ncbi:CapA family protein [Ectobacillus ponti]|uniref:CapA family protein n=1 Tax=Ectobacillus ponti TaxID=2961894 RepID=UPI003F66BE01